MGIFRRCTDILSANLNDLIDRFEDPEKALRQAIREMEQAVSAAMNSAAKTIAGERLAARQLAEHRQQAEQWLARARQAVGDGDESLARRSLVRKSEHDRLIAALADQQAALEQAGRKLRRQIDGMRARVAEANRKLTTLSARKQAADAQRVLFGAGASGSVSMAFSKFDRLCHRVDTAEAEAEAWTDLTGSESGTEDTWFADDDAQIDQQLQALRDEAATATR
ncbi:MAG: PspA/IM30 family protein [Pirellulales bacterium]